MDQNDEDLFGEDNETFTLNIGRCIADKTIPAVIRGLFMELRDHGYTNTGKFFQEMSDIDLDTLNYLAEQTHPESDSTEEESNRAYEVLALFGMALTVGEGRELTMENAEDSLKIAISYIAIESLSRRGLVEAFHENWTMDRDDTSPIVKAKDL